MATDDPNWRSRLSSLKAHRRVSPVPSSRGRSNKENQQSLIDVSFAAFEDSAAALFKSGAVTVTPAHVTRAKILALSSSSDRASRPHDVASSCQWGPLNLTTPQCLAPSPKPDENDGASDTSRPLQQEEDDEDEEGEDEGSAAILVYHDSVEGVEGVEDGEGQDLSRGRGVAANLNALNFGGGESLDDPSFGHRNADRDETCDTTISGHDAVHPLDVAPLVSTPPRSRSSLRRALTLSPSLHQQHQQQAHREVYRDHRDPTTSARIVASPTHSKTDCDFSRRLARGFDEMEAAEEDKAAEQSGRLPAAAPAAAPGDEWKEALSPEGKRYYYNRRTRESSWRVPANAVVVRIDDTAPASEEARLAPASTATLLPSSILHCPACAVPFATLAAVQANTPDAGVFSFRHHVTACLSRAVAAASSASSASSSSSSGSSSSGSSSSGSSGSSSSGSSGAFLVALRDLRAAIDAVVGPDVPSSRAVPKPSSAPEAVFRPFSFDQDGLDSSHSQTYHSHYEAHSQYEQSYSDETSSAAVEVCPGCRRRFALGRLEKHLKGCRTINERAVPSNSARKRIVGTPMELFVPGAAGATPKRGAGTVSPDESGVNNGNAKKQERDRPFSSPLGRNLKM